MRDGAVGVDLYNAKVAGMSDFRIDAERIGGEQQPAGRRNLAVRRKGGGVVASGGTARSARPPSPRARSASTCRIRTTSER